jgi:hypothetical protein
MKGHKIMNLHTTILDKDVFQLPNMIFLGDSKNDKIRE